MMELLLVKAIAAFFKVNTVMVCAGFGHTDVEMDKWATFSQDLGYKVQVYSLEQEEVFISKDESMIVLLDNEDCLSQLASSLPRLTNIIWLFNGNLTKGPPENLRLDSDFITMTHDNDSNAVELFEHYSVAQKKTFVTKLGTWTPTDGLYIPQPDKWARRNDLEGFPLVNVYLKFDNLFIVKNETSNEFEGFMPEVLKVIQSQMNFTVEHYKNPKNDWGVPKVHKNGTEYWTGFVGELVAKKADMCFTGLTITSSRSKAIDFTSGVFSQTFTILLGTEVLSSRTINTMAFVKVLSVKTWLVLILTFVVYAVCHYCAELVQSKEYDKHLSHFSYGFILTTLTFLQLSGKVKSWKVHKVMFLALFVTCLFSFEGYKAHLTADMTAGQPKVNLKSFQDIIDNDITIMVPKGVVVDHFFQSAKEGTVRHKVNQKNVKRMDSVYGSAFVHDLNSDPKLSYFGLSFTITKYNGRVKAVMDFDGKLEAPLAIGLQKDSELRSAFNYHISKMRRSGVLEKIEHKWISGDEPEDNSDRIFQEDIVILSYDNLFLPFNTMALGIMIAIGLAVVEKVDRLIQSIIH